MSGARKAKSIDWKEARERLARAQEHLESELSPEETRRILDERSRRLAETGAPARIADGGLPVVTFSLAHEFYALELGCIREVARLTDLIPVPGTPDFLAGLTNLRGEIVSVIDLRKLFGIPVKGLTDLTRLIVLGRDRAEFGILADEVQATLVLGSAGLIAPPDSVSGIGREYLRGLTKDAVIVLDGAAILATPGLVIDQTDNSEK